MGDVLQLKPLTDDLQQESKSTPMRPSAVECHPLRTFNLIELLRFFVELLRLFVEVN